MADWCMCVPYMSDFGLFFLVHLLQVVQVGWVMLLGCNFLTESQIPKGLRSGL